MKRIIVVWAVAMGLLACTTPVRTPPEPGPDTVIGADTGETLQPDSTLAADSTVAVDTASPAPDTIADAGCSETSCDDGDLCNGLESCDVTTGQCAPGTSPVVDDGIDCTVDTCDPKTGVSHTPDNSLCAADGLCLSGVCDIELGCQVAVTSNCCGNDIVEMGEVCDDGNADEGDGCSAACALTSLCDSGCTKSQECPDGLTCVGWPKKVEGAFGQCTDTSPVEGEETPCTLDNPCGEGLACLGAYIYDKGWCVQGWMAKTFTSAETVAIPDGDDKGITTTIVACGLATVPVDVVVTLDIDHPQPQDLVVTLYDPQATPENPGAGAKAVLWDHVADGSMTVIAGIPGDDSVNGSWKLQVTDTEGGQAGTLKGWSVYLLSRWD